MWTSWEPWTASDVRAHRVMGTDHLEIFELDPPAESANPTAGC